MPVNKPRPGRRPTSLGARTAGVSLVEVLVTMLILGVGLLGLASLQTQSMRLSTDAYLRGQATVLAGSLIGNMRMRGADQASGYTATPATGACARASASVVDELRCWHAEVGAQLPGGVGSVTQDATEPDRYVVTVSWLDRDDPDASAVRSQAWTVELR